MPVQLVDGTQRGTSHGSARCRRNRKPSGSVIPSWTRMIFDPRMFLGIIASWHVTTRS